MVETTDTLKSEKNQEESPKVVNDSFYGMGDVVGRLKLLYDASRLDLDNRRDLNAFRDLAYMVLDNEINELNDILRDFSRSYEDLEFEPVEMDT